MGKLPIAGGFGIYGKLGMLAWNADLNGKARVNGQLVLDDSYGEDGTDPFYGLGAEYVVNRIMLRGEYERYDISEGGEDFEIDMLTASIGYRF